MESEGRCDQIDQRGLVCNRGIAEQVSAGERARAPVSFDAPPVIDSLKNVFAVFTDLQLYDDEAAIASERQQVYGARGGGDRSALRGAKLRVERGEAQARVEPRNVAPEHGFKPSFRR